MLDFQEEGDLIEIPKESKNWNLQKHGNFFHPSQVIAHNYFEITVEVY